MANAAPAAQPALLTADEFLRMPDGGVRRELVRGEVCEMTPAGSRHGRIGMRIAARLSGFVEAHGLGEVYGPDTGFMLASDPDTVRVPDVSFVTRERATRVGDVEEFWPGAPDLAIEVISPTDRFSEVDEKIEEYFAAGCRMVVIVNPRRRIATVYRSPDDVLLLREDDVLDGGDVVPGWTLPLAEVFRFDSGISGRE
ncbi:MAG TPA: Uma2 family endonuclease [Longimicrobium sp.]|nr:Uma2 family endonuclease [Longimicrobium sp.]